MARKSQGTKCDEITPGTKDIYIYNYTNKHVLIIIFPYTYIYICIHITLLITGIRHQPLCTTWREKTADLTSGLGSW